MTIINRSSQLYLFFFFSSRRRHTRLQGDWSSDVCSSDLGLIEEFGPKTGKMTGARVAEIQSTQIRLGEATAYARASRLVQLTNCREAQQKIGRASCRERV